MKQSSPPYFQSFHFETTPSWNHAKYYGYNRDVVSFGVLVEAICLILIFKSQPGRLKMEEFVPSWHWLRN
jgi:hypothetical protein